jgi:hypothetical protein
MLVVGKLVATVHACRVRGSKAEKDSAAAPTSLRQRQPIGPPWASTWPGSAARISHSGLRKSSEELK